MHPYTALLAAEHLEELRREANSTRRAEAGRDSHVFISRSSGWSRLVGRSARGLSAALDAVASRLDPVPPCDESPLAA
jgi:hypothetical protein